MQLPLPNIGRYRLALSIDERQSDVLSFEAKEAPAEDEGDPFADEVADPADLADAVRKHMKCPWAKEDW